MTLNILLDNLLELVEEDLSVLGLEDKRRTETDGRRTAATDLNTDLTEVEDHLIAGSSILDVDSDKSTHTTSVGENSGIKLLESTEVVKDISTSDTNTLKKVVLLDGVNNRLKLNNLSGITEPGVEDTVGLSGTEMISIEETTSHHLLGEGDGIRGSGEVPSLVSPHATSITTTSLDLINNEASTVLLTESLKLLEEISGSVVITTLGLNGLDNKTSDGALVLPLVEEAVDLRKAALLLSSVLSSMRLKRVLELGEGSDGPVESREVELVHRLGVSGGEAAEHTAVESTVERHDGEVGRTRGLVDHARREIKVVDGAAAVNRLVPHHDLLVGVLVGARTTHEGGDLLETLGSNSEESLLDTLSPVSRGEVAESRTVHEEREVLRAGEGLDEVGVVVTEGHGGDLGVEVEHLVLVNISNVVTRRSIVVSDEVDGARLGDLLRMIKDN